MMKKRISMIALFAVAVISGAAAIAQPGGPKNSHKNPEARKAVRAYIETNVWPMVSAERAKLDSELSPDEQAQLEAIRGELKVMHDEFRANRTRFESGPSEQRREPTEEEKQQRRENMKKVRQLKQQAWEIVDAHETTVYALLDGMADLKEQWREDIRGIMEEHRPEDAPERSKHSERMNHGHNGRFGARGPRGLKFMLGNIEPVGFVLLDPNKPLPFPDDDLAGGQAKVYPNPTYTNGNKLTYGLTEKGIVTIVLIDGQGNHVKEIVNKVEKPGQYEIEVDLDGLQAGTYFYEIMTPAGRETIRVIKEE